MSSNHHELWESDAEARYLETRLNGFWNQDYLTRILLPLLDLRPGMRVLDVGAGNGAFTLLLARHLPGVHFVGVDITLSLVEEAKVQAQKLNIKNVEFWEGNALELPFEDEFFDSTVCQTLLIHLGDPAKAVAEMSRVLKRGGTFMAAEFHTLFPEMPIESGKHSKTIEEETAMGRYLQMLLHGYRKSGQGDMKIGGRVPFLARKAGLSVVDVRINDRVPHAFPPYNKPSEEAALGELQIFEALFKDAGYRAWLTGAITAGGGTEDDVDAFLKFFPSHSPEVFNRQGDFAFVWLLNPVLLITVARKDSTE
jgi:ubiquinone/menaquinone biosynthesis C-methylase UbiE